jgi:hypothetical protein
VVGEVQAKLVDRASAAAHNLARPKYDGMQLLVSGDRLGTVGDFLDKVLRRDPDSLRFAEYTNARANLTDTVEADGVRSTPMSRAEVHRATENPESWARRHVVGAATCEVGAAVASGALAGGVVSGLVDAAGQTARVRAGETSAAPAACTAAGRLPEVRSAQVPSAGWPRAPGSPQRRDSCRPPSAPGPSPRP